MSEQDPKNVGGRKDTLMVWWKQSLGLEVQAEKDSLDFVGAFYLYVLGVLGRVCTYLLFSWYSQT